MQISAGQGGNDMKACWQKQAFGYTEKGEEISLYQLEKEGLRLEVTDLGGCIVRLLVPDREGIRRDVVLGYDTGEQYLRNPCFLGAMVGPSANRTAGAEVTLDGVSYHLPRNEGENNLHTDAERGLHKKIWKASVKEDCLTLSADIRDGEYGLPGNIRIVITYEITEGGIRLCYHGETDRTTLLNLTNHSYFNLSGHDGGRIDDHMLRMYCGHYTPLGKEMIPTGEIRETADGPMDFSEFRRIGDGIGSDDPQIALAGGYDHNFIINGWRDDCLLRRAAEVRAPGSGIVMEAWTTLPGMQFYTGNFVEDPNGKTGISYKKQRSFCLEMQYFPDSLHKKNFPQPVFGPGHSYEAVTEYRFSVGEQT